MAYTPVQVCNLALAKVGDESAQITSLPASIDSDYSKEANLCFKFYETTLREVLAATEWNCATTRKALAVNVDKPVFGWEYSLAVPADCARPLEVTANDGTDRTFRYRSEWDIEGNDVVSNHEVLWMKYIKNMSDLSTADSLFIKTLYTSLAIKLAYPLTEDRNLVKDLMNELATDVLPEARRVNGYTGHEVPAIDSSWLEATYSSFSGVPVQRFDLQDDYGTIG